MDAESIAADVLHLVGERFNSLTFLYQGATSRVWRLVSDRETYVLRVIDDQERVVDGSIDRFIRQDLIARGGRVAEPVLDSETTGRTVGGIRWSLDLYIAVEHPDRGALSEKSARALGKTLGALHQIPATGCGKARRLDAGLIVGEAQSPLDGVMQRFENPLPGCWEAGFQHPVLATAPDLTSPILKYLDAVAAAIDDGEAVLCHTDLHEKQLICAEDDLAALLDFGDASILNRYWDLGSTLYFHGPGNFAAVLAAYRDHSGSDHVSADLAQSFSAAIAMHHGSRSRHPGKQHRLVRAVGFLRSLLNV